MKLIGIYKRSPLKEPVHDATHLHKNSEQLIIHTTEFLIASYGVLSTLVAIGLFFIDTDVFFWYTREDGIIEYSTTFFLLATFLLCVARAFRTASRHQRIFYLLAALAFFFGFGEEISWGQRIFDFATPEELMRINAQKEVTIHNIELYGVSFKKVIFRLVLNSCVLFYFVGFPVLSSSKTWFKKLVEKYKVPVPTLRQSLLFLILFFSVFLINEGKKWELVELNISCFTFLAFLFPANR